MTMPEVRGRLVAEASLASMTWLRVGGPCDYLFQPADVDDLAAFLRELPSDINVFPMGVGSNLIVRDGGLRGVVVKLGRGFNGVEVIDNTVKCGAAALDAIVARKAADAGIDLTFLRTIPGSIGGAVRLNAGCYGTYTADVFVSAQGVTRKGEVVTLTLGDLSFAYRQTELPPDLTITEVILQGPSGDPSELKERMKTQLAKRDKTQPTKELTAGSTFRNPAGYSSTGREDDTHELKAWTLIDAAGMRGATLGGAQMSEKHSNFLINTGGATAADLENLGELVRKKVAETSGLTLDWEVMRVGEPTPDTGA